MDYPEVWVPISGHPGYIVSNYGRVSKEARIDHPMSISRTMAGHAKIGLIDETGFRRTRSVAVLVAEAFVEPEYPNCDRVIVKNMDYDDLRAENLAWRPDGFAWEYSNQFKHEPLRHYVNLRVADIIHEIEYQNIIEAATHQGLLFKDVWRSTYSGEEVFPTRSIFTVVG